MLPIARKNDLVVQEMGNEVLIYDLKTDKAICLNETSALVWQNCDGKTTVNEIAKTLEKKLGKSINEDLVWFALTQLGKENLITEEADFSNKFAGLTRREIIKRVGITTAVALPIVTGLVAPVAAQAVSCAAAPPGMNPAGSGCPCASPGDCTGGPCMTGMC